MSVCTKMAGGLGNQMFQFMAGLYVSDYLQTDLILDLSSYYKKGNGTQDSPVQFDGEIYALDFYRGFCFRRYKSGR